MGGQVYSSMTGCRSPASSCPNNIHSYIYEDPQETSAACAIKILSLLEESLAGAPAASLAISGGSTPKLLFGELAKAHFDWSRVHLFWVDERGVPPTDAQSNYKLAKEHLIDAAGIPASNVHRIQAELEPETAARLYAEDIRSSSGWSRVRSRHLTSSIAAWGRTPTRPVCFLANP